MDLFKCVLIEVTKNVVCGVIVGIVFYLLLIAFSSIALWVTRCFL